LVVFGGISWSDDDGWNRMQPEITATNQNAYFVK
jgi:hypothetical protein